MDKDTDEKGLHPVKALRASLRSWAQDQILRRVVGSSSYLFASNAIGALLSIVTAGLLGVKDFGVLGIITSFVVNINRLLSFRMSDVVVKYMGEALARQEKERAAAVIKAAGLLEALTSLVAFGVLLLLAPLGARYIAKDAATTSLFILYGLIILANLITETSTGVLRVTNHFRTLALINLLQSILVAVLIVVAAVRGGSLLEVMGAYLVGKVILGIGPLISALYWLPRSLGRDWWKAPFSALPPRKEFFRFAISTNFSGTINIFARDSEVQWTGFFFGPTVAGYFKVALALVGLIIMPIDPFIATTYPEITRSYVMRQWGRLRSLIQRVTVISFTWTAAVAVGLLLLGRQVLFSSWTLLGHTFHIYKSEYLPAYPVLLVILVGYGFANTLFWNRSLLLAQGKANTALWIPFFAMLAKVGLAVAILPHAPYIAEACILSGYFIVSVGLQTWRGLVNVKRQAEKEPSPLPDPEAGNGIGQETPKSSRSWSRNFGMAMKTPGVNRWDWLAAGIFLAFAGLYFLGRLQGNYPLVILTGDGGNIASFAAAADHPDMFSGDPALGEANNYAIYATLHIPLIRALNQLTGDYGLAYALLVFPQTFLQLLGFYILGRVLFKHRLWAFLLSFLTAMTVINIGLGEIWGIWQDALPRLTFQSLLPYLLALVLVWKDAPRRWPWLMLLAGAMVYVHPISAPAWGFAIWLSLWLLLPRGWTWMRRTLVMLGLGVLFLVPLVPFALNYLSFNLRGQSADYTTVMTILQTYQPANLMNAPAALGAFLVNMTRSLLLPVGLAGLVVTWVLKKGERTALKVVLVWMAGIFITSILIPSAERLLEQRLHILPLETELVRGIRYFIPLLLLFWLWPFTEGLPRLVNPILQRGALVLALLLAGFWSATNRPALGDMLDAGLCMVRGRLVCASPRPIDELLIALRTQSQPGEGVIFYTQDTAYTSQTLSVRYEALRPLVYTLRDSGILGYSNRSALQGWLATTRQMEELRVLPDPQERLEALVPLATSLGAKYLVIDFEVAPETVAGQPVTIVMQNEAYLLLKLH